MTPRPAASSNNIAARIGLMVMGAFMLLTAVATTASAAPLIGDFPNEENGFMTFIGVVLIGAAVLAIFLTALHFAGKLKEKQRGFLAGSWVVAAITMIVMVSANTGGAWAGDGSVTPAAASATGSAVGGTSYAETVTATFVIRDETSQAAINGAVLTLYKNVTAYDLEKIYTKQATLHGTCTADANGLCKLESFDAGLYDGVVTVSGYYPTPIRGVDLTKIALNKDTGTGVKTISPPLLMKAKASAFVITKTSSTIASGDCTAGTSTCPITVLYGHEEASKWISNAAVKIVPGVANASTTAKNLTFASIQSGSKCVSYTINGDTYVYDPTMPFIATGQYSSCPINLNYASGAADGTIVFTVDDGFKPMLYNSMRTGAGVPAGDYETNSNWANIAAASRTVTR